MRKLDFGATFGTCSCNPTDLPELHALPDRLRLERLGSYVAGANPLANTIAGAWYLLGLGRSSWGVRLGATLLVRAMGRVRPPLGTALILEALGEASGSVSASPTKRRMAGWPRPSRRWHASSSCSTARSRAQGSR